MQFQGIALRAHAVTPHDTNTSVQGQTIGLYIGTAGTTLTVTMADGTDCVFTNPPVGWMPISVTAVKATGTDADDIVALFNN